VVNASNGDGGTIGLVAPVDGRVYKILWDKLAAMAFPVNTSLICDEDFILIHLSNSVIYRSASRYYGRT